MEQNPAAATLWRMWVDTKRRIVSFHPEDGFELLEFRDQALFFRCVDEYTRPRDVFELRGPIRLQAIPLSMTLRGLFVHIPAASAA